jgi:hypothetical protein
MKELYERIACLALFLIFFFGSYSQITWSKSSGAAGAGNFTISGIGSVTTLNSDADIALLKHGSGTATYYTCNSCTINLQITDQFIIDYPLYLTSSRIIIGKSDFSGSAGSASLLVNGNSLNPKQALFLDNSSSIQLEGAANFINLQGSPTAYIYINYAGGPNSLPVAGASRFAGTDKAPLCGLTGQNGANSYSCNTGQVNGPSLLNVSGFSIISPLPVVLVGFSANLNSNKTIGLNWSTQMEVNLSHFTIERSADGANWASISTVQANGNAGFVSYYSFTDLNPLSGFNYYRLQMTDLDNKSGFTAIILVRIPIFKTFKIFPNPSKDYVDITLSKTSNGIIRLLNQFGQVLQQKQITASNDGATLSFQLNGYPEGSYVVEVIGTDGSQATGRIVIVR